MESGASGSVVGKSDRAQAADAAGASALMVLASDQAACRGRYGFSQPAAVERRVLSLVNPVAKSAEDESTTRNLAAAIQILLPGESARPHRHSMNALRFVLEGSGALTMVDGKACAMEFGDLILTPAWCWHEHVHGGVEPMIWLDALDVPFHLYLGTAKFQPGPVNTAPADRAGRNVCLCQHRAREAD